jgi:hypothetical protein
VKLQQKKEVLQQMNAAGHGYVRCGAKENAPPRRQGAKVRKELGISSLLGVLASWRRIFVFYLYSSAFICGSLSAAVKPKVAVFPLGGDAAADLKEKIGFSLRAKLNRDGHYQTIDGPTMIEMAAEKAIDFATSQKTVEESSKDSGAEVLIWGELNNDPGGSKLRLKVFDLSQPDPLPHEFEKVIGQPTELRFVVEDILQTLEGVKPFEHPSEEAVADDEKSKALFAKNPNLVVNGDFSLPSGWQALLGTDVYAPPIDDALPEEDRVGIYRMPNGKGNIENVLAMNLSKDVAEGNGLACLSDPIAIEAHTRYRLTFRYRSDGPSLHVFVKGYTTGKNVAGEKAEREVYRRQVPLSGSTDGKWVTVTCDLSPKNPAFAVEHLRLDLYAYLSPGVVMFDDVQLKAVGEQ